VAAVCSPVCAAVGFALQCAAAALWWQLSQHHQRGVAPQRQLPAHQQPGHHSQGDCGGQESCCRAGRGGVLGRRGLARL
jgi:hypothetical protein